MTVQSAGTVPCRQPSRRSHSGRQARFCPAGRIDQATGTAQPRYTTLIASTTNWSPRVVASSASANCRPDQLLTIQASSAGKHGSTSTACRPFPRFCCAA